MFLTQIIDGQITELELCESCAKKRGLFDPQSLSFAEKFCPDSITDKVNDLVKELASNLEKNINTKSASATAAPTADMLTQCPVCSFGLEDLRRSERLGCPDCYSIFAQELKQIKQLEHPASPPQAPFVSEESQELKIKKLELAMSAAIEDENYERAAELRDEINSMKGPQ